MSNSLSGKVVLVTGGSRGIGAATVRALAEEGAIVAFSYSSSPDKAEALSHELESKGLKVAAFKADQAVTSQVEGLVNTVAKKYGRLDILVNNAGVSVNGSVSDANADIAGFDRQYAINVTAVATAVRAAVKHLPEGGRIISVGSGLAERVPFAGIADYSATKAAVATYTKGWARDLGPKGITVNVVQPGPVNTDMNPDSGDFAETLKATTALGRYGRPEEIAAAIVFLAGPGAAYITGTTINVDGGFAA